MMILLSYGCLSCDTICFDSVECVLFLLGDDVVNPSYSVNEVSFHQFVLF